MKLYIAGPMTGLPDYNLPFFQAVALGLRSKGYDAHNPGHRGVIPGYTWQDYLRDSLRMLLDCDAVALLPDWEQSRGALLEVHVAKSLEMRCAPWLEWISEADAA